MVSESLTGLVAKHQGKQGCRLLPNTQKKIKEL